MKKFGNIYLIPGTGPDDPNIDSNTYVVKDETSCVIDPGLFSEARLSYELLRLELWMDKIPCVINTHCHYDHAGGDYLFEKAEILAMDPDAKSIETGDPYATTSLLFGKSQVRRHVKRVHPNEILSFGKTKLKVIHTPGHTKGSFSLYDKKQKILICGDLIFADGNIGRVDLPTGSSEDMKKSVKKVSKLDVKYLLTGHGPIGDKKSIRKALDLVRLI